MGDMPTVFISLTKRDQSQLTALIGRLERAGFDVIAAPSNDHGLTPNVEWLEELRTKLETADFVIFWVTQAWEKSRVCFLEMAHCRWLEKPRVLPIVWHGNEPRDFAPKSYWTGEPDKARFFEKIIAHIQRRLRGVDRIPKLHQAYPGLGAFREDQHSLFHGRSKEIDDISAAATKHFLEKHSPVMLITGGSGVGKSSLLRAGIYAELKRRFDSEDDSLAADAKRVLVYNNFRSELSPARTIEDLRAALALAVTGSRDSSELPPWDVISQRLASEVKLNPAWHRKARGIILIDSFEQWLTEEHRPHLDKICDLANSARFNIVAGLRSEFLPQIDTHPFLNRAAKDIRLAPLGEVELREAICDPALLAGAIVDEGLIAALIAYHRNGNGTLPIIALSLSRVALAAHEKRATVLSEAILADAIGSSARGEALVQEVVQALCDSVQTSLEDGDLEEFRSLLFEMATQDASTGTLTFGEGRQDGAPRRAGLIAKLTQPTARVLTTYGDRDGEHVRLVHDSVVRTWPAAASIIEEIRASLAVKADIQEWLGRQGPADAAKLLQVEALSTSQVVTWRQLLEDWGGSLSPDQREFVELALDKREKAFGEIDRRERELDSLYRHRGMYLALLAERTRRIWEDYPGALLFCQSELFPRGRDPYKAVVSETLKNLFQMRLTDCIRTAKPAEGQGRVGAIDAFQTAGGITLVSVFRGRDRFIFESDGTHLKEHQHVELCDSTRTPLPALVDDGWAVLISKKNELDPLLGAHLHHPVLCSTPFRFDLGEKRVRHAALLSTQRGKRLLLALVCEGDRSQSTLEIFSIEYGRLAEPVRKRPYLRPECVQLLGTDFIQSIAWSGPGPRLFIGGRSAQGAFGRILNVDFEGDQPSAEAGRWVMGRSHRNSVTAAAFSRRGNRIITGGTDRRIYVHPCSAADGSADSVRLGSEGETHRGHRGEVTAIDISPLEINALSSSVDGSICLWDLASGALISTMRGHRGSVSAIAYFPDGRHAVSADDRGAVMLWDVTSGTGTGREFECDDWLVHVGETHERDLFGIDSSGGIWRYGQKTGATRIGQLERRVQRASSMIVDGATVILALCTDGTLWRASTRDGKGDQVAIDLAEPISAVQGFSSGEFLLGSEAGRLYRLDVRTGIAKQIGAGADFQILAIERIPAGEVSIAPEGAIVVGGISKKVALLREGAAPTWQHLVLLRGKREVEISALRWCSRVKRLFAAGSDSRLHVWSEAERVEHIPRMADEGHLDQVTALSLNDAGTVLASGSRDNSVRLWDTHARIELATLHRNRDWVTSVNFSGDRLIVGSADRTVREWAVAGNHHTRLTWSEKGEHYAMPALRYADEFLKRCFPTGLPGGIVRRYGLWAIELFGRKAEDETD